MTDNVNFAMYALKTAAAALAAGCAQAYPIKVNVPERGYVSLQILDSNGQVVGGAISPEPLEKGARTVDWDMRDAIDGGRLGAGEYSYRAVWVPDHTLTYRGCFYPTPLPDGQTPWHNARSGGGGWLADHFAPKSIVRVGDFMYITAMCEAAHGLIKCDKDLNKLWGTRHWVFNTPYTSAAEGDIYYGFKNGKGNCYVMAAMFCEMAKLLGYDAHQISGRVPLKAGGYGPHSWVEVTFEGTTYVCDPDFTEETKRNGYMITYGQSGTWVYQKDSVMS